MKKNILNRPFPNLIFIFKNLSSRKEVDQDLFFFQTGREAFIYGLEKMGIRKGSKILLPAFICDSLAAFIISEGYKIRYVDINMDMSIDLYEIESIFQLENISAFLFVYFFGISFDIKPFLKLCNKYNVPLIEDCSHSFQTKILNNNIGTFGDFTIYSFRKILPTSDGGAIRFKKEINKSYKNKISFSLKNDLIYLIARLVEIFIRNVLNINIYSKKITNLKNKIRNLIPVNKIERQKLIKSKNKISFLLNIFLTNKNYLSENIKIRNDNFNFLLKEVKAMGLKPFITKIKKSTCPQFFIIKDDHGGLVDRLNSGGIGAIQWPGDELPKEIYEHPILYPNSIKLNKMLVYIPIHQNLNKESFKEMLILLSKWKLKIES